MRVTIVIDEDVDVENVSGQDLSDLVNAIRSRIRKLDVRAVGLHRVREAERARRGQRRGMSRVQGSSGAIAPAGEARCQAEAGQPTSCDLVGVLRPFPYAGGRGMPSPGGAQHNQASRQVLGRAFVHAAMKEACKSFGGGTLKKGVAKGLPAAFAIPAEIRELAETFVELQERRHVADYDLTDRFKRSNVLLLINLVERRVRAFTELATSDEKRFFLA